MLKKFLFLLLFVACSSLFAVDSCEFEKRWDHFQNTISFRAFEFGKSDEILKEEFHEICRIRDEIWLLPEFAIADYLVKNDLVRAPGCVAFAFNNTEKYYNASTIFIADKEFIACEGPRSKDVLSFFQLIKDHQVSHLIRLTAAFEGQKKKCHPYWEGLEEGPYLMFPSHQVLSYNLSHWKDNQGIDPKDLIDLINQIKNDQGLWLVHCSAGVGRTGTFLAAFAIIKAIDEGSPLSIEEIVYRLSLQRILSVAKPEQYITLYRLAETYLTK